MEIRVTWSIPSPAAVPEGTWFSIPDGSENVEVPHPMDVWENDELFTCSWKKDGDKYIMIMSEVEAG